MRGWRKWGEEQGRALKTHGSPTPFETDAGSLKFGLVVHTSLRMPRVREYRSKSNSAGYEFLDFVSFSSFAPGPPRNHALNHVRLVRLLRLGLRLTSVGLPVENSPPSPFFPWKENPTFPLRKKIHTRGHCLHSHANFLIDQFENNKKNFVIDNLPLPTLNSSESTASLRLSSRSC
jgi:hypothetical protein